MARVSITRAALWFVALSVPAAVAAYYRIFSGFAGWDDEGTELAMVKQYLSGAKLYQEVFSPYGPVYYFYNWLLHSVLGLPLSHDAVRFTSAAVVLLCSVAGAWLVLRLTNSLVAATVAHLVVYRGLQFFGNEPGHPQELCLMLVLSLAACGLWTGDPRTRRWGLAAAGSVAACLLLIKVNVGIFAIVAITLALVFQSGREWWFRAARAAAGLAALALPFLLMRSHLDDPSGLTYCFVVTISLAALLAGPLRHARNGDGRDSYSPRDCIAAVAGFAVTFAASLAVMVLQGVPLPRLFTLLVLKHVNMSVQQHVYYLALYMGGPAILRFWLAWGIAGLLCALLFARAQRATAPAGQRIALAARCLVGGAGLLAAFVHPTYLLGLVAPFCWLILYPPRPLDPRAAGARVLLCTTAVLQALVAYPMAGSQSGFIRILLLLVTVVLLHDGLGGLSAAFSGVPVLARCGEPAAIAVLAGIWLTYPFLAYRSQALYGALIPLGMPGAVRIHVTADEAAEYRWLVDHLSRSCDTFVGLPQYPSLYFWTGKPLPGLVHRPPGALSMDTWMLTHSAEEQQVTVDDLEHHPNACAIYSPMGVWFWYKGPSDLSGSPLAQYILTRFKVVDRKGDYSFMIRKERQLE